MKNKLLKYYSFIPLLLLCAFYIYRAVDFPAHDFANYYFGGKFLADGKFNSSIYFPYEFNKTIFDLGYPNIFTSYAPNTPFLAILFLIFSFFSLTTAKLIFNCISAGLLIFSLCRLFKYYKINPKYALLIPVVFLVPIKNSLLFGQVYFLLFFFLNEGWLAYEKKQWKSAGFFWSFAIFLKVFPVLLLVFLIFKKKWKPLIFLSCFSLLFFGISVLFTGFDIWIFYLKEVLSKAANGEIATAFVPNYQSVFMFLKELLVFDTIENPKAFFNFPIVFSALMIGFKIGILTIGYFVSKRLTDSISIFSFWILAMIILSPYGSTYTFVLLLFPFLALIKSNISLIKKGLAFTILFLINNLPLSLFLQIPFPFSYLRLFFFVLFFVLFVLSFRKNINWKIVSSFSIVSLLSVLLFTKSIAVKSCSFLDEKAPILIYDYQIIKDELVYFYWNEMGEESQSIRIDIKSKQLLKLKNKQLFYKNQQLTFDNSHKLKPMLINNDMILFLSDYERGIGFYSLRKIKIP